MKEIIELKIRLPKDVATAVKNLLARIPDVVVVSETPYNKSEKSKYATEKTTVEDDDFSSDDVSNTCKFVLKCKEVVLKIGELNGKELTICPKGNSLKYTFQFNVDSCCNMLDILLEECSEEIDNYLGDAQKPTGISIVLPFIGKILSDYIFSTQHSLHKQSLIEKLQEVYVGGNIQGYLSFDGRKRKNALNDLFKKAVDIANKKNNTPLNKQSIMVVKQK